MASSLDAAPGGASASPGAARRLRMMVADQLYPPPVGTPPWWLGGLVFVLASVISLLRVPLSQLDTIWAEDGDRFLQGALDEPFPAALALPYSGYVHLVPRGTAEVASLLPLDWAGFVFSVTAALVVGLAAWSVWTLGAGLIPSAGLRAVLVAGMVLVPPGGLEAVNNVANSHFYLMFASFWALVGRPRSTWAQVLPAVIVVSSALSDPVSIVLLPLAVGRLVIARSWRDRSTPMAYFIALALQLAVALSAERAGGIAPDLRDVFFGYALRVVGVGALGLDGASQLVAAGGSRGVWLAAGLVAAALLLCLLVARRRLAILAAALASLAFFFVACFFALGGDYPPTGALLTDLGLASRYTLVPIMLLLSAGALAAQGLLDGMTGPARFVVIAVLAVPILLYAGTGYRADAPPRASVQGWSEQVQTARTACTDQQVDDAALIISPGGPWDVQVSCADLGLAG